MKHRRIVSVAAIVALALAAVATAAQPEEAQLKKEAKISKAKAEQSALSKVPDGRIKSAEIEREKGHLVWSFDIARSKTRDIIEVLVDARTGAIISTKVESPADEAREALADRKRGH